MLLMFCVPCASMFLSDVTYVKDTHGSVWKSGSICSACAGCRSDALAEPGLLLLCGRFL